MKTNLPAIKELAKLLLHEPLGETEMSPMIMTHPFFTSDHALIRGDNGNEFVEIWKNKENFNKACKPIEDAIDRATDVMGVMVLIRPPYYGAFVKFSAPFLSEEDFAHVLSTAWVKEENPNMDANVSIEEWVELFKKADPKLLMDEDDYNHWKSLVDGKSGEYYCKSLIDVAGNEYLEHCGKEYLVVYRGVAKGGIERGLSWTESEERAEWFANRFGEGGNVLRALVRRDSILAYFDTRGEEEVVVFPPKILSEKNNGKYIDFYTDEYGSNFLYFPME